MTTRAATTPMDPVMVVGCATIAWAERRDVIAAARRDVREARDDRLFLRELLELVVDAVRRERAAARRVDVEDHAFDAVVEPGHARICAMTRSSVALPKFIGPSLAMGPWTAMTPMTGRWRSGRMRGARIRAR